jgi:hypothetical protein
MHNAKRGLLETVSRIFWMSSSLLSTACKFIGLFMMQACKAIFEISLMQVGSCVIMHEQETDKNNCIDIAWASNLSIISRFDISFAIGSFSSLPETGCSDSL